MGLFVLVRPGVLTGILVFVILFANLSEKKEIELYESLSISIPTIQDLWQNTHPLLIRGFSIGLVSMVMGGLFYGLIGIVVGLFTLIVIQFLFLSAYDDEESLARMASSMKWPSSLREIFSRNLINALLYVGIMSLILSGLIESNLQSFILFIDYIALMMLGVTVIVVSKKFIRAEQHIGKLKPNQGIQASLKSGLLMTAIWGVVGLCFGIMLGKAVGNSLVAYWMGIHSFVIAGILGFFNYGGQSYIQHYVLRWFLARENIIKFSIKDDQAFVIFLDIMKDFMFLRRVGGGWIFIHHTLLNYFASLHPKAKAEVEHE